MKKEEKEKKKKNRPLQGKEMPAKTNSELTDPTGDTEAF
jgi:hypothetical protein